ncbi:FAD dependent oxidoreductase superfamily [Fusarium sporotrichioides]|uniref:FAD dependent oxidoreductase superfamily n=1 Tax=Fusarium sporotrichioides TaxID=5514 RepID=A0A395SHL0_FUSSP|nr:FAD dependent oxidoreductase superfamily [Fusarium sporotrichioides]
MTAPVQTSDTDGVQYSSSMAQFLGNVSSAILKDPGLPRPNPTISAWQVPVHPTVSSIQSSELPEHTDFVVIGSGITGCSVTKTLLEHGAIQDSHVTVLEARTLVSGATGRNGGHLVTAAGHIFGPLAQQHGIEAAKQITRFSILNIQHMINMVKAMDQEVQDDCQIRDVRKVMAVGDDETWAAARNSSMRMMYPSQRWNIKGASGAVEHDAGAIWPYRLLTGIYQRLLAQFPDRLAIETNTPATKIEFSGSAEYPYAITTSRGTIKAKKVIHCTNGHASHLLPQLSGRIYPFRGTMSVHKPGPELANVGASKSWSLSHKPTLDIRTGLYITGLYYLQQNALTGRVWIGNETAYMPDILTADDTYVPEAAVQALSTVLPKFFVKGWGSEPTSKIESIWSGIQGHTADGLPVVGQVPASVTGSEEDTGQWIAAGFNGYGMDKCWLTGEALVKMMLGEDVSGWFPQCYLINGDRLQSQLTAEATVEKFANLASEPLEAKL